MSKGRPTKLWEKMAKDTIKEIDVSFAVKERALDIVKEMIHTDPDFFEKYGLSRESIAAVYIAYILETGGRVEYQEFPKRGGLTRKKLKNSLEHWRDKAFPELDININPLKSISVREIERLKSLYKEEDNTLEDIAEELRRPIVTVNKKISDLGLERETDFWSDEEEKFLMEKYGLMSASIIADLLSRSEKAVKSKYYRIKIDRNVEERGDSWTYEEKKYLKENYSDEKAKEIASELGRSVTAVYAMAGKLGLSSGDRKMWSDKEEEFLRNNFDSKPMEKLRERLGRSLNSIKKKASRMGLM